MRRTPFLVAAAFTTALMAHAGEMPDFSTFDTDGDGLISEGEFVSWKTAGDKATEAEAVAKFAMLDSDGNGTLSEEEFEAATASIPDGE